MARGEGGGAPVGNKNAERWDLDTALAFADEVLLIMESSQNVRTIGKAALRAGHYAEVIAYIENKFPDVEFKALKKARELARERLIDQALDGDANTAMAIFVLKNNHGMVDKVQNDHTIKTEQPLFGDDES